MGDMRKHTLLFSKCPQHCSMCNPLDYLPITTQAFFQPVSTCLYCHFIGQVTRIKSLCLHHIQKRTINILHTKAQRHPSSCKVKRLNSDRHPIKPVHRGFPSVQLSDLCNNYTNDGLMQEKCIEKINQKPFFNLSNSSKFSFLCSPFSLSISLSLPCHLLR